MAGLRRDVLATFKNARAVFFYKTMTSTMVADGSKDMGQIRLSRPSSSPVKVGKS